MYNSRLTATTNLLQGLVIYKACRILWDLQLALLDMLAELPWVLSALSSVLLARLATSRVTYMLSGYWGSPGSDSCASGDQRAQHYFYLRLVGGRMSCWGLEVEADILLVAWRARFNSLAWRLQALARPAAREVMTMDCCESESTCLKLDKVKTGSRSTAAVTCKVSSSLSIKICGGSGASLWLASRWELSVRGPSLAPHHVKFPATRTRTAFRQRKS